MRWKWRGFSLEKNGKQARADLLHWSALQAQQVHQDCKIQDKKNNRLKPKKGTGNDPTGAQRIKASRYVEEKSKQEETSAVKAGGLDPNLFLFPTRGDVIWKDLLKDGFKHRLVVYPSEHVRATSVHRHIGQGWWYRRWVRCQVYQSGAQRCFCTQQL